MNNASKGRCVTVTPRGIGIFDCRLQILICKWEHERDVAAAAYVVAAAVTGGRENMHRNSPAADDSGSYNA